MALCNNVEDIVNLITNTSTPSKLGSDNDSDLNSTFTGTPGSVVSPSPQKAISPHQDDSSSHVSRKFFSVPAKLSASNKLSPRTAYVRAKYKSRKTKKIRRRLRMPVPVGAGGTEVEVMWVEPAVSDVGEKCVGTVVEEPVQQGGGGGDEGISDMSAVSAPPARDEDHDDTNSRDSGESGVSSSSGSGEVREQQQSRVDGNNEKAKAAWIKLLSGQAGSSDKKGRKRSVRSLSTRQSKRAKSEDTNGTKEQVMLDVGQKKFGAVQCSVCGMVYSQCEPEDEVQHRKFHNHFMMATKFQGWKTEHVISTYLDGRVIEVKKDDPQYAHKKVQSLLKAVDADLGYIQDVGVGDNRKVYLYISDSKQIIGCCVAEHITHAYRLVSTTSNTPDTHNSVADAAVRGVQEVEVPSNTTTTGSTSTSSYRYHSHELPACLGINRIWTLGECRRRGVASRLIDSVRHEFLPNHTVERCEVAFSDPTAPGKAFAMKYADRADFLVYPYRQH